MEWILVRRRVIALLLFALVVAGSATIGILYAVGVSHLDRRELRHFAHEHRLMPRGLAGLIFERVPPE